MDCKIAPYEQRGLDWTWDTQEGPAAWCEGDRSGESGTHERMRSSKLLGAH